MNAQRQTREPPTEMINAWREQALRMIEPATDATPEQRKLAWRFLLQHGVKRK